MKTFLIMFALALITFSCSKSSTDKNELLISAAWATDPTSLKSDDGTKAAEVIKFSKDGGYSLEAGNLKVHGKWSWEKEKDNEILLVVEGLTSDNGAVTFDKTTNYNVRILEITDKSLRILEKGEGDAWESGFAKEKQYLAQPSAK
jgi:hypothetical protein